MAGAGRGEDEITVEKEEDYERSSIFPRENSSTDRVLQI